MAPTPHHTTDTRTRTCEYDVAVVGAAQEGLELLRRAAKVEDGDARGRRLLAARGAELRDALGQDIRRAHLSGGRWQGQGAWGRGGTRKGACDTRGWGWGGGVCVRACVRMGGWVAVGGRGGHRVQHD